MNLQKKDLDKQNILSSFILILDEVRSFVEFLMWMSLLLDFLCDDFPR